MLLVLEKFRVGLQPVPFRTGITSLVWHVLEGQGIRLARRESKSTQRPSNAPCAPSALLVPTIFAHISALILTSGLSCAQYAVRHLLVSMTANAMRGSTLARRSSSVEVISNQEGPGVAVGDLREPMHWAATSGAKPEEYVYVHYSRRKRQKGSATKCLLKGRCLTPLLATWSLATSRARWAPVRWTQAMEWCSLARF